MFTPVKRFGPQRLFPTAFSAFKSEKLQGGFQSSHEDVLPSDSGTDVRGPFLNQDNVWKFDNTFDTFAGQLQATQSGLQSHVQLLRAAAQQQLPIFGQEAIEESNGLPSAIDDGCSEQPALDMEAFLQELSLSDASSQEPTAHWDYPETTESYPIVSESYPPLPLPYDPLMTLALVDPTKAAHHFNVMSFEALGACVGGHLWNTGPIPDVAMFYLFRKVHGKDQADQAVAALMTDRELRNQRGVAAPYSEVTSAAVFNALNRTGGEAFVVAAAERAAELGLTLSRSNMYHLMKQYSVQGKVDHVEKLFRSLEASGKSWNSNCIVIMMLAYFNQGRFEDADKLRRELNARGIKISERIEHRLDNLLAGEEKWRWEEKVFYRPKAVRPPPGFNALRHTIRPATAHSIPGATMYRPIGRLPVHELHTQALNQYFEDASNQSTEADVPPVTLKDAVKEPRIHLNLLRSAGFNDLLKVLNEFVQSDGPVENVCISFLFRKVETEMDVIQAMAFLKKERDARGAAGISQEYNETTCSRIFSALFKTGHIMVAPYDYMMSPGASEMAFSCAEKAQETGLVLSGKALHELIKSYATRNDVEKVEEIWKLVKLNGKPSSRIVYSIFRTYFDNGMMDRAMRFNEEIQRLGIKLSASAMHNIEDVLAGTKSWVKDPHAVEF